MYTKEQKVILIVDDDHDLVYLLTKQLTKLGFACRSASTVVEALEMMRLHNPDLVILDLNLPRIDGTAFLSAVKKEGTSDIPILVISGYEDGEVVQYILDNGARGFIHKPIDSEALEFKVNELIYSDSLTTEPFSFV